MVMRTAMHQGVLQTFLVRQGTLHGILVPGTAVLVRVLQGIQAVVARSAGADVHIPSTAVGVCVLQALHVAGHRCVVGGVRVPGAAVLVQELQTIKELSARCIGARICVPGVPILVHKLQAVQVAAHGSPRRHPLHTWTADAVQELQARQVTLFRGVKAAILVEHTFVIRVDILQDIQMPLGSSYQRVLIFQSAALTGQELQTRQVASLCCIVAQVNSADLVAVQHLQHL